MTPKEAMQIVGLISAAYPRTDLSEATVEFYAKGLMEFPYKHAEEVVAKYLFSRESEFFPPIGAVRAAILETLPRELQGPEAQIPSAAEAWAEVTAKMRNTGLRRTAAGAIERPEWTHNAVDRAVMALGWENLCLSQTGMADRAHFMTIYGEYREIARREALRLTGGEGPAGLVEDAPDTGTERL